jgi:hypothetical protein
MGEQTGTRQAALDRKRWQRRLRDRLAGPATPLRPHDLHHLEPGWDVFEDFGHVLAELAQHRAATAGAGRRRLMHGPLARQMRRHWLAAVLMVRAGACCRRGWLPIGWRAAAFAFCHALFDLAEHQFELLDLAVKLLRGTAKPVAPQRRELRLEMLDLQRLGVEFGVAHHDRAIAFGKLGLLFGNGLIAPAQQCVFLEDHPPQRADIARKRGGVCRHAQHKNLIRGNVLLNILLVDGYIISLTNHRAIISISRRVAARLSTHLAVHRCAPEPANQFLHTALITAPG